MSDKMEKGKTDKDAHLTHLAAYRLSVLHGVECYRCWMNGRKK